MYKSDYESYDLTTNNLIKSYPKGQTFEIIKFTALNSVFKKNQKILKNIFVIIFIKIQANLKLKTLNLNIVKKS